MLALAGCFHAGFRPRPAEFGHRGRKVWFEGDMTVYSRAPSRVAFSDGQQSQGNAGYRWPRLMPESAFLAYGTNTVGGVYGAIGDRLELGGNVGVQEQGLSLRVSLLAEGRADPFSAALASEAYRRDGIGGVGFGGRVGIDLSQRINARVLFASTALGWGPEGYWQSISDVYSDFRGLFAPAIEAMRPELRWHFGVGWQDAHARVSLAPYYVVHAGDFQTFECDCDESRVAAFSSRWGVHFLVGFRSERLTF